MQKQPRKIKLPPISITELLATNKTADMRRLLKKYNLPDATGYEDLQKKLVELYQRADDKLALEKQLAELHPHREWILKYCTPAPISTKVQAEDVTIQNIKKDDIDMANVPREYLDATGAKQYSDACGCGGYHGFSGSQPTKFDPTIGIITLGIVAIAVAGLLMHNRPQLWKQ